MHLKLKLAIHNAIEKAIEDNCEDDLWSGLLHDSIYQQMTEAAALVFDSSMEGQEKAEQEAS
jgi:hypothetical protein